MVNYIFLLMWNNGDCTQCDTLCYGFSNEENAKRELKKIFRTELECSWACNYAKDEINIVKTETSIACHKDDKFLNVSIQEVKILND